MKGKIASADSALKLSRRLPAGKAGTTLRSQRRKRFGEAGYIQLPRPPAGRAAGACPWGSILIIALVFIAATAVYLKTEDKIWNSLAQAKAKIIKQQTEADPLPFRKGEKFLYKVKLGIFTVGSAELIFEGRDTLDGRDVYVISLESRLAKVYDKEKIYADVNTFNPIRVERDIDIFGKRSKILEEYDQDENYVKIQNTRKDKTTTDIIHSDESLQNVISMIYFYRNSGLKLNSTLDFNFPTKKIKMKVSKLEEITVPKGKYKAFLLESTPKKYKVWFDTTNKRIPLKINGAIALTGLTMVLDEVH